MSYTKGKWNIVDEVNIDDDNGLSIATVFWNSEPHHSTMVSKQEGVCNRHLISSAPELLEACKAMIKAFQDAPKDWLMTNDVMQAESIMIESINKATTIKI
jgi:hypothetical protein